MTARWVAMDGATFNYNVRNLRARRRSHYDEIGNEIRCDVRPKRISNDLDERVGGEGGGGGGGKGTSSCSLTPVFSTQVLAEDLLNPSAAAEARKHKLKVRSTSPYAGIQIAISDLTARLWSQLLARSSWT